MSYDSREQAAHGAGPVELYLFNDGASNVWPATSADTSFTVTVGSQYTFVPRRGLSRNPIRFDQEAGDASVDVTLPADDDIVAWFATQTPSPPLYLSLYGMHREDSDTISLFTGMVLSCAIRGAEAVLHCTAMHSLLLARGPRICFQAACNWAVYSAGCGKTPTKVDVTISQIAGGGTILTGSAFGSQTPPYWQGGWVEKLDGTKSFVLYHPAPGLGNSTVQLQAALPGLVVGNAVKVVAGCDQTISTCHTRFNNVANFLGFNRIPDRNPFDPSLRGGF